MRCWPLALALLLLSATSMAQPDADRERALELGRSAVEVYNARRWVDAYERFAKAEAIVHSPVFVLYMARSKRQLGNLNEARRLYQSVVDEQPPPDSPPQWADAQRDARDELVLLEPAIPTLTITVPASGNIRVWLDDRELASDALTLPVDPGQHNIVAQCNGLDPAREAITVAEGEKRHVALAPSCILPPPEPALVVPPPAPISPSLPDDTGDTQRVVGIALMIGGGTLLAVGAGTGIGAAVLASNLDGVCDGNLVCPPDRSSDVDTYYALAHTSTTTLIVGGVAFVAGLVTYLIAPEQEPPNLAVKF